uniref:Uncharacterized protein n=1 Tax=Arundo donax TaxID=35708 RepID=A0A0A9FZG8_ARUDO
MKPIRTNTKRETKKKGTTTTTKQPFSLKQVRIDRLEMKLIRS